MTNEYVQNILSSLQQVSKYKSASKSLACKFRLYTLGNEGEPTYLEVKERTKGNDGNVIESTTREGKDIFGLNFAKNYLVLISNRPEIEFHKINNHIDQNDFYFLGFLSSQQATENTKAMISCNPAKFKTKFKADWHDCFILPVEKITTMIRLDSSN